MFLSDNYYRTYNGFVELIYSEFIDTNYFHQIRVNSKYPHTFLSFLRIVFITVTSYPELFEFDDTFITYLECLAGTHRLSFSNSNYKGTVTKLLLMKNKFMNKLYDKGVKINLVEQYSNWGTPMDGVYTDLLR